MKDFNRDFNGEFEAQASGLFKTAAKIWIIMAICWLLGISGVIYFIFWCLKHFNVIH